MTIPLIDKQDNFEIVLARIAVILAVETLAQVALAVTALKPDPTLWAFTVFLEASNPIASFQINTEATPIVNVWFDDSNFPMKDGNVVSRQASETNYNIDIYAASPSADNPAGGYTKGDEQSSKDVHRIIRLVRNIMMHPDNTYLQFTRGQLVWRRWIQSIQTFQPQINDRPVQNVIGARNKLNVKFNETPVIEDFEPLESVFTTAKRAEDGKIVFESEIDTT